MLVLAATVTAACGTGQCKPSATDPARSLPGLYAVSVEGGAVRQLLFEPQTIVLSPDWAAVAIVSLPNTGAPEEVDIVLRQIDGGGERNVSPSSTPDAEPAWSEDGASIVFTRDANIWVMAADGSDQRLVADTGLLDHGPGWLPDGRIVFYAFPDTGEGPDRFFVVEPDGSDLSETVAPPDGVPIDSLAWSPDGRRVAYVRYGGPGTTDPAVYVADVRFAHERRVVDGFDPAWSPDDRWIAIAQPSGGCGESQLAVVHPDGGAVTTLTSGGGYASRPVWSPDGRRVAFIGGPPPVPID
jgi:Tol biopolymer transport system component